MLAPPPLHSRPHRRRHRRRRRTHRRAVDDEHRHGRRRGDGRTRSGPGARRLGARARHREHRRSRGRSAAHRASGSHAPASSCRSSATSTSTATACSRRIPACAEALAKYRINPGNVGRGSKRDPQFAEMIEVACRNAQAGAHRRQLGQPRPGPADAADGRELAARAAARCQRCDARGAGRAPRSNPRSAPSSSGWPRPHRHLVQGQRRAGPDRGLSQSRAALRLRAAPRPDRGRHGLEGHRRLDRRHGGAAAGRHRRHDPRLADAGAERRPHAGSHRRAGDPADAWACARSRRW